MHNYLIEISSQNKTQMILLSDVVGRYGVEVLLAKDDADTLIVKTSLRYGFGKVNNLKTLCQESAPEEVFQTFNNLRATKLNIYEAGVTFFQYLYSNIDKPLNQQNYDKCNKLMTEGVF